MGWRLVLKKASHHPAHSTRVTRFGLKPKSARAKKGKVADLGFKPNQVTRVE
jgi:hypothetical protein